MEFLYIGLAVLAVLLVAYFTLIYLLFKKSFGRNKGNKVVAADFGPFFNDVKEGERDLISQNAEVLEIKSFDGLTLRALWLKCDNAKRTVLCVHGYQSRGTRDFSCVWRYYSSIGCNLLIIDHRACGKSEGEYITFGVKERFDVAAWAKKAAETAPDLPIFLDGISLGGTTVLLASELPMPENVVGIVADCGFTSPWDICKHVVNHYMKIPAFPSLNIANLYCRAFAGFSLKETSAQRALEKNKYPIFFLHGGKDDFVPTEMSRINFEAARSEKELHIVEEATHGLSYLYEPERCQKAINDFFLRYDNRFSR